MVTSVTPILCITLAFWLGRGRSTCARTEMPEHRTNKTANRETVLRFRELMVFLLVMGLPGIIQRIERIKYRSCTSYSTYCPIMFSAFQPAVLWRNIPCRPVSFSLLPYLSAFWFFPQKPERKTDTEAKRVSCAHRPSALLRSVSLTQTTSGSCHARAAGRNV